MADLRIRWRRGESSVAATAPESAIQAPSIPRLGFLVWATLALILAGALAMRLYNVNWDALGHLHPDERHITSVTAALEWPSGPGEYFDTATSPLNPYNLEGTSFVYGTFPVFLTKAVATVIDKDDYDGVVLVGRHLAAIFDAGSVVMAFFIGRRLYGSLAGLLAAILFAFAPLAIQHSHFFVVDPFLTFFTTAGIYVAIRIAQGSAGGYGWFALMGLAIGLGTATKLTALILLPVLVLAVGMRIWPELSRIAEQRRLSVTPALAHGLGGFGVALLVGFVAFRVAQPYAFEAPKLTDLLIAPIDLNQRFVEDQKQQSRLLGGEAAFPPSVQWIGRESYIFPLQQMVRWGMAPAFGIAGWAGFAYAAYRLVRYREVQHLLLLAFVLGYFGFMGRQFSLYLRYFLPLYPVLAVLAGYLLVELVRGSAALARRRQIPALAYAGRGAVAAVVALAMLAGLAYLSIYTKPVTRIEANRWIVENIPAGKSFAVEHWDDRVPGHAENRYTIADLPMYDPDTPEKVGRLIERLTAADYIVLSSNRLLVSIPRNPVSYPVSSRYYDLLLDEELGFRLLRSFTSYPSILGIEFPDHGTEESWSSYDHPRVLIFEKTPAFSRARLEALLGQGPFAPGGLTPAQADRNALLLSEADRATQQEGGTWNDVFASSGIAASSPMIVWLIAVEVAALATLPLALLLFRRLPDRGYLLTKPLGLLFLAYPVWLLVSLKLFDFQQATVLLWLVALIGIGTFVGYMQRERLLAELKANWRLFLFAEALFLVAFLFFYELRLLNPDLWHSHRGGEKPMDLAYFTAVTRSTTLPPYDPWFAGGYINYYYLGQFFTATLTKLTAIRPEVAFNLAVPTYFAFTAGAAFSIAYGLAGAARSFLRRRPGMRRVPSGSLLFAGVTGAVFVAIAGNLDGVGQLVERLSEVSSWQIDTPVPLVASVVNSIGGLWQVVFHGADLREFDYWRSSRMMPPTISITEFPYWSFLFADLHAHVMSIPFDLLAIGVCLAVVLSPRGEEGKARTWLLVALLGLIVGSLRWLNSWDYPPFLLLGLTAVAIGERRLEGGVVAATMRLMGKGLLLVALSFLFYQPFLANYQTPVSGLEPAPETTPIHQYLAHFGLFAAVIGVWLLYALVRALRRSPLVAVASQPARAVERYGAMRSGSQLWLSAFVAALILLAALILGLLQRDLPLVAVLAPVLDGIVYLAVRELRLARPDGGLRLLLLAMLALAVGLSAGVDLVTIKGDIVRMNTVFKFYVHIWLLFALVASYALWYFAFVVWGNPRRAALPLQRRLPSLAAGGALAALVIGALLYPIFATPVRLNDRFADLPATSDGMAYMETAVYDDPKGAKLVLADDLAGIEWLRANVEGTPAIVEGRTDLYRWGGRFSIYTGLPTVLGWDWHQTQQRGPLAWMVEQRSRAVDQFYTNPDAGQAQAFLRQYGIRYVIVGQVERLYYPGPGLDKFRAGLNGALEVAYENSSLTIYRVKTTASGVRAVSP
jgi:YYY domain-containing protein